MRKSLKCFIVPFALVLGSTSLNPLFAQVFTNPVADEFVYSSVLMKSPVQTANYSIYGLHLAAWSTHDAGGSSEFIYTFADPANPTNTFNQGSFIYKDVMDLEVGHYYDLNLGGYAVAVAYYLTGKGHMMDIYQVNNTTNTLSLAQTIQLSTSPQYGRIRMDSHFEYGIAVVWERPGVGIETMVGKNGTWSGIIRLNGTMQETAPDVAFSHSDNSTLNLHFVYRNPTQKTIRVTKYDYDLLRVITANNTPVTPTPVDVISMQDNISNIVIECPDHYHTENWAYTFTNEKYVFVRHIDRANMVVPQTTIVNNGSLGNIPTADGNNKAYKPSLHYGDATYNVGGYTGQIHVGWYNIDNVANGVFQGRGRYIGVEMREAGGLISDPDYMGISQNAQDVLPDTYSAIAFSKMGEGHWGSAPQYMYTTYATEITPGGGLYQLNHAFHKWPDTRFKGANTPPPPHPDCGRQLPVTQVQTPVIELNVYPNPFKDALTNNVTMTAADQFELSLTDISGRQVGWKQVQLNKGRYLVELNNLGHLIPGTYFLSSFVDGKITGTKAVVKQ